MNRGGHPEHSPLLDGHDKVAGCDAQEKKRMMGNSLISDHHHFSKWFNHLKYLPPPLVDKRLKGGEKVSTRRDDTKKPSFQTRSRESGWRIVQGDLDPSKGRVYRKWRAEIKREEDGNNT